MHNLESDGSSKERSSSSSLLRDRSNTGKEKSGSGGHSKEKEKQKEKVHRSSTTLKGISQSSHKRARSDSGIESSAVELDADGNTKVAKSEGLSVDGKDGKRDGEASLQSSPPLASSPASTSSSGTGDASFFTNPLPNDYLRSDLKLLNSVTLPNTNIQELFDLLFGDTSKMGEMFHERRGDWNFTVSNWERDSAAGMLTRSTDFTIPVKSKLPGMPSEVSCDLR